MEINGEWLQDKLRDGFREELTKFMEFKKRFDDLEDDEVIIDEYLDYKNTLL